VQILRGLNHPNIIRLYEVLLDKDKIFLVMEMAQGGELLKRLEKKVRCSHTMDWPPFS
jgi:serine/threonine protein kinase